MRKILSIILCLSLCVSFCGCSFKADGLEKGLESLVSAIGFQQEGDVFSVYLETITVNSEDSASDKKLTLTEGNGKNLADAFEQACLKTVRPFMFSHCAVAVIGSGITAKRMREICRFLYNKDEINLSLRFIYTENAKELLSCETVASVAVGYDLADALDRQSSHNGIIYQNRFYEVEAARKKAVNIFALPHFTADDDSYESSGLVIFKNDAPVMELNQEETLIYSIATENQTSGTVFIDNKEYALEDLTVQHEFNFEEKLETKLNIDIKLIGNGKPNTKIATLISELFIKSKLKGADIFMFGNVLHKKNREIWSKAEHDYYNIYKNSQLAVTVK